jgi:hypothetical protein
MMNETKDDEKDLETLKREYRNMENNRKSLAEENIQVMRKQQQTLEKFRAENESLKTDVATLQARTTMKPLNAFEQSQLDQVTVEIETTKHLIDSERRTIAALESEIKSLKEMIWQQRRRMGGSNAALENQKNAEKQLSLLENRLDQAIVKFNKTLANNRTLRETIDDLRSERVSFEAVYKKLEKNLQEKKRQMAQVIENSNLAYELRDKARLEIAAISQSDRKEQEYFDKKMEDLGRELEAEINAAAERRKQSQPMIVAVDEESRLAMEKANNANALRLEEEKKFREREDMIKQFEIDCQKIEDAIGVSNVDELLSMFQENDEKNFSLFSFTNEQAQEITHLKESLVSLREKQNAKMNKDGNISSSNYAKELETKIETMSNQAIKFEEKTKKCQSCLQSLQDGVKMLVTRLDCGQEEICNTGINETNILYYMGVIEKRANQIIKTFQSLEMIQKSQDENQAPNDIEEGDGKTARRRMKLSFSGKRQKRKDELNLTLPKVIDYSSDDNSYDENGSSRPLTMEELKSKTLKRLNQPKKKNDTVRRGSIIHRRRRTSIFMDGLSRS